MKKYYALDIQAMQDNNLSPTEWMILENIHFLSAENGWCFSTKKSLAEHHDISRQMMTRYVAFLVEKGWLKKNTKHHLKVTKKWINLMTTKVSTDNKSCDNKSFIEVATKVSSLPIKKELKREKRADIILKWCKYRKQIKKPLADMTIENLIIEHNKDPKLFEEKVEHSIKSGYQGLFPPKQQEKNNKTGVRLWA